MDNGAHFYACDFQVHTPRDRMWKGKDCTSPEARLTYAQTLVAACRKADLQAIAVTDHHDMAFVSFVRRAAAEETDEQGAPLPDANRLVVFPGMELTLGVPCQALLIFDAAFPDDMFQLVTTALTIMPTGGDEAKTAEVVRLDHIQSLVKLKEELDKHAFLRGRYIILPNVSEGGSSLLRKGSAGKYVEMPCVGGYVDRSLDKLGQGNREIIAGKQKEWGNKRIACFQTSDSRHENHNNLGEARTWVKWATPTAEALRQACLAPESRISQDPPLLPAVSIASISVSNSLFLGPIELGLSPQFTALIGGRGTGKSTVLEYLRWALCDQPPGVADSDAPNYEQRRRRLIDTTLKPQAASVEVRFEVNGVMHVIRRNSADGGLLLKIGDGELQPCSEDDVRTLLLIQAYSQKQLSDVSVRLEELGRFITAPIRSELAALDRKLAEGAERVRQSYGTRRRQRALERQVRERALEEKSLAEQAAAIRKALTGLSDDDRKILDDGPLYQGGQQAVDAWLTTVRVLSEDAAELRAGVVRNLAESEKPPAEPHHDILQAAYEEHQALLGMAKEALSQIVTDSDAILQAAEKTSVESPWSEWKQSADLFKTKYDGAVQRSSAHKDRMTQLQQIEETLGLHRKETARVREALKKLGDASQKYSAAREAWHKLHAERADLIDGQCQQLTTQSGSAIRANVRRYADPVEFVGRLRSAMSGSGFRGEKVEQLGKFIVENEKPRAAWEGVLDELELLAEFDPEHEEKEQHPPAPVLVSAGLTPGELQRFARTLKPESWLELSLSPIRSVPEFEYLAREKEYIPFANASAGQQATALLKTLLNQPGPPLIIDQPEEDLDNPVILEIVEQIWSAKKRRQVIFASHNANLVVNGDAELVLWFEHRKAGDQSRGRIAGEGAIDVEDAREAIKRIMEGGEAAFNLRKAKYGF